MQQGWAITLQHTAHHQGAKHHIWRIDRRVGITCHCNWGKFFYLVQFALCVLQIPFVCNGFCRVGCACDLRKVYCCNAYANNCCYTLTTWKFCKINKDNLYRLSLFVSFETSLLFFYQHGTNWGAIGAFERQWLSAKKVDTLLHVIEHNAFQ